MGGHILQTADRQAHVKEQIDRLGLGFFLQHGVRVRVRRVRVRVRREGAPMMWP